MMAHSTIAFSVSLGALILATTSPAELAVCAGASLLPDVDMSRSYAGRFLPWVARWLEHRWAHRTITHSFAASIAIAVVLWPLNLIGLGWVWRAVVCGYSLGWFSDTFTKAGVCAFWPAPHRLVMGKNPRYRLETGSRAENWVFGFLLVACCGAIALQIQGGIFKVFSQALAMPAGAVSAYEEVAFTHRAQLEILNGFEAATLQPIRHRRYDIVKRISTYDLLVRDGDRFFQAGTGSDVHLHVKRARVLAGQPVQLEVAEAYPSYVDVADVLEPYREREVYVTGRLELKGVYNLPTANSPSSFAVLRFQYTSPGEGVALLESCPIEMAIAELSEFYATTGELQFLITNEVDDV
ncbi:MAG: metal-dependent hydrolase [Cyanobacteria bacterium P01_E01_bin.34]